MRKLLTAAIAALFVVSAAPVWASEWEDTSGITEPVRELITIVEDFCVSYDGLRSHPLARSLADQLAEGMKMEMQVAIVDMPLMHALFNRLIVRLDDCTR